MNEKGKPYQYVAIRSDITERKRAEEQLREQATLLDNARDAILVRDLDDSILFWNKGAERIYGWRSSEVMGRSIRDFIYKASLAQFDRAKQSLLASGEWVGELRQLTKDGREIVAESRWTLVRDDGGNPKSALIINTDITDKNGGLINVYSEVGRGTQFTIHIPAAAFDQINQDDRQSVELPTGDNELILVVDDEMAILEITRSTLEMHGYRALTASDGTEAVALYAQHKDEIKVVLTDMMMPYRDGPATIRALQKLNPRVKIIASSGLTETARMAEISNGGVSRFLTKPYTAEKLLETVAEVLKEE